MLFQDRAVIRLEEADSTNNYAANLVRASSPPEGTVITAQAQLSGKGQRGAVWESEIGQNLLCSVILYPDYLNSSNQFYLTKVVALAMRDVIESLSENDTYIKWPNDIIVKNKKIAGILIEAAWSAQKMQSAVVGIGLNVNQTKFDNTKATSLKLLTKHAGDVDDCLKHLLNSLEHYLLKLKSGQYTDLSRLYREHLFRLGQVSRFIYMDREVDAMITGVDEEGRLRLCTDKGDGLTCALKEIKFVL